MDKPTCPGLESISENSVDLDESISAIYTRTTMSKRKSRRTAKRKNFRLSVMVIHRIEDTMVLAASVEAYKKLLAAAVDQRYSPKLRAGEELPSFVLSLELTVRDAQVALDRLVDLDEAVDDTATELESLRQDRSDLVAGELHPRAVAVRGAIELAFGKQQGRLLHGLEGRTRRKPAALQVQVRRMVRRLIGRSELPTPANPHAFVDRDGWIRQLEPLYRQLVTLNRRIGYRAAALSSLVAQRKISMRSFDADYRDALRFVKAVFAMARFDARALKNLKPYYQRRLLSQRARKRRETRAAQASEPADVATEAAPEETEPPSRETARVTVSKTVAKWLETRRIAGIQ